MKLSSFIESMNVLNGSEVRYLVAGGLAMAAHGYGRAESHEPFDFDDDYARAVVEDLDDGTPVRFVDVRTLIRMKEGTGRAKDQDEGA